MVSRHLADMDRASAFLVAMTTLPLPPTSGGQTISKALHWFMSLAMPDRTTPTVGDSMAARAGMDDYYNTAEVGYRYFGLQAVGDYERFRKGQRTWAALLYGAPEIHQEPLPFTSSHLSSGWISLRQRVARRPRVGGAKRTDTRWWTPARGSANTAELHAGRAFGTGEGDALQRERYAAPGNALTISQHCHRGHDLPEERRHIDG